MNAARVLSMLALAVATAGVCVGLGSDAQQRSDAARPMPVGAPIACVGDLNGDGVVNVSDLLALLGAWGPNEGHPADINGDGVVNVSDLLILLGAWGDCPGRKRAKGRSICAFCLYMPHLPPVLAEP